MIPRYLILVAVAIATAAALAACGSDGESAGDSAAGNAPGNAADRMFVAGMIPHHESAVDMAELAQERAKTTFVKSLAEDIIKTQGEEIAFMREQDAELAEAGVEMDDSMGGHEMMNAEADMAKLEAASDFDAEFMTMMIEHHEGAITMAKAEQADGKDPELKALAGRIIEAQQREIEQMQEEL